MSIERSVHNLRNSMQALKQYKVGMEETFYNMLNFDNKLKIELEEKPKLGKTALVKKVLMTLMFLLVIF